MKITLRSGALTAAVGVGMSLVVLPVVPAGAATGGTHVRCNDINALKTAVNKANSGSGPGRITLASHCTYTLTAPDNTDDGLPEITGNVTITGRDTTIRRASSATQDFRIFNVVSGGSLTLNSLTVSGGRAPDSAFGGGGISNDGTLKLNRSVLRNNYGVNGGGLLNLARADLDRTSLKRNTADFGGGINNNGSGTLTMKGGSLLDNRAPNGNGGGLDNVLGTANLRSVQVRDNTGLVGGGLRNLNASTMRTTSTTVRDNIALSGAGLSNVGSTAALTRSLITRNTAITAGGGILNEADGQVTLTSTKVVRNRPDNCSPAGSVSGCSNPAGSANAATPPAPQLPLPARTEKIHK